LCERIREKERKKEFYGVLILLFYLKAQYTFETKLLKSADSYRLDLGLRFSFFILLFQKQERHSDTVASTTTGRWLATLAPSTWL
jgi:hypothetical protein